MIFIEVKAVSGHYGRPGLPDSLSLKQSFPFAPPSTIQGFIESLCGMGPNSFDGKFCYGVATKPRGKGNFFKLGTYWLNEKIDEQQYNIAGVRPITWETYIDPSYIVGIEGPMEEKVKKSLNGEVERFGILSLGTSDDEVYSIKIVENAQCQWIREGGKHILPIESPKGFHERFSNSAKFDLDQTANNNYYWFLRTPK
jgi:CRISPR-associated Cas5-like protein